MNSFVQPAGPTQHPRLPGTPAPAKPKVPGTLTGAAVLTGLAALLGIITLVVTMASGKDMLLSDTADAVGLSTTELANDDGVQYALQQAFDILQSRAVFFTVFSVIFLALLLPLRGGRTWARVTYSICAPISIGLLVYTLLDEGVPSLLKVLDGVNAVAALVALVLVWMGPSNAFNRARKNLKGSHQEFSAA